MEDFVDSKIQFSKKKKASKQDKKKKQLTLQILSFSIVSLLKAI